jgi:hypothetical protein
MVLLKRVEGYGEYRSSMAEAMKQDEGLIVIGERPRWAFKHDGCLAKAWVKLI